MCGRFSIIQKAEDIEQRFSIKSGMELYIPVYNAAPGQNLPVITGQEPARLNFFRWGLIPFWAKDEATGYRTINARVETISEKPAFRSSLKNKRCLVIADGFYEWKKDDGHKQPYRILMKEENIFAFAGLWDYWENKQGRGINTFTIITTEANTLIKNLHDRMPVIINKEDEKLWLDNDYPVENVLKILKQYPSEMMKYYTVSKLVNSPADNSPEIVKPI